MQHVANTIVFLIILNIRNFSGKILFVSPSYFCCYCTQPCPVFCRDMNPRYSLSKKSKMGKNSGGQPLDGC